MEILMMLAGAAVSAAAAALGWAKLLKRPAAGKLFWLTAAGCAVFGGACGWMIPQRVSLPEVYVRLLVLVALFAVTAVCDGAERRIPNAIVLAGFAAWAVLAAVDILLYGMADGFSLLLSGVVGCAICFGVAMLFRVISRGGLGYGDIKFIAVLGCMLGAYGTFSVVFFAQMGVVLGAVVMLALRRLTVKDSMPFGPFFPLGFFVTLVLGTF